MQRALRNRGSGLRAAGTVNPGFPPRRESSSGRGWARFPVVFLLTLVLGGGAVLVLGRLPAALRCRPAPRPNVLLVECAGLGDYEHAAYALGLEPAARTALGRARVVVVGNSRAQFAFSTPPFREHFARAGVPLYLAGFGAGEGSAFALDVLRGAGTRPRALVVNADPFFAPERSQPARVLQDDAARATVGAWRIKLAFALRAAACGRPLSDRFFLDRLCHGGKGAIYRDPADGAWLWQGSYRPGRPGTVIEATSGDPLPPPSPETVTRARDFLAALGVAPGCVLLTAVPNGFVRADAAVAALAGALDARAVLPAVADLRTLDGSHLDAASAERWSQAFLDAAGPDLAACAATPG